MTSIDSPEHSQVFSRNDYLNIQSYPKKNETLETTEAEFKEFEPPRRLNLVVLLKIVFNFSSFKPALN